MASKSSRVRPAPLALIVLFALFSFLPLSALAQPDRLLIGILPEINLFKQKQRFQLLGEYLTHKTGIPVEFTIQTRYGNVVDDFTAQKLDGAFFGSFTGAMAISKLGVVPLARPVSPDGSSTYHGLLLVRQESGINSAAAMRGKRMAFVDKYTTAGYLFPLAYLRENGVQANGGFFRETYFAGSHDAAITAVLDGKADIAAVKHDIFEQVEKENPRVKAGLKIIASSQEVPSNALCVRRGLPAVVQEKLKAALLGMEADPEGKAALAQFGAIRFVVTTGADYRPVFEMATRAGIDIKRYPSQ